MKRRISRVSTTLTVLTIAVVGAARAVDDFEVSRSTIDGGGVMFSTGGDFELSGTIGQPDAGTMAGGDFSLSGGFWFAEPPGDCNSTGNVNLLDYDDLQVCLSGPDAGLPASECNCFDIDNDSDVDLSDIGRFQVSFTDG